MRCVIGGGNVAIDIARTAERIRASQINMYSFESHEEMPTLDEKLKRRYQTERGYIIMNLI